MAVLVTLEQLLNWQQLKACEEKSAGGGMFFQIPDRWYEDKNYGCACGHVSQRYLSQEEGGSLCLACFEKIAFIPPEIDSDEKLQAVFKTQEFLTAPERADDD